MFTTNLILDDIISAVNDSAIVIADISGRNPNVLYELGMAHILKRKQTIMVTHDGYDDIPFDICHFRTIQYKDTIDGKVVFEETLRKTFSSLLRDYRAIYGEEFEIILKTLFTEEPFEEGASYALIGLKNITKPVEKNAELHVEGHDRRTGSGEQFVSIDSRIFLPFKEWNYVEEVADFVVLTEKGKAFAEFLEERGFICDYINGTTFTPGYSPELKSDYNPHPVRNRK
jgi:hypothetical protein